MTNSKARPKFLAALLMLASTLLAACASTGSLDKSARIKLAYSQVSKSFPLVDARPASEKMFRARVIPDHPESVALGDENFSPERMLVLNGRLQDALKSKLTYEDEIRVERFEVFEYIRGVKTPTAGEVIGEYVGSGAPEAVRSTSPVSALTQVLALPLVIPIQQRLDRVVTSVAEVELRVQIKGKSYTSKMARYLENGDREYGVSEAFNSAFDYLVYDIENGLTQ